MIPVGSNHCCSNDPILFPLGFTAIMWLEICRMQNQKYTIIICTVGQTMKPKKSLGFNMGIEALAQLFDPCCQHVPFPGPCCAQPWFVFHESCLSTIGFPQKLMLFLRFFLITCHVLFSSIFAPRMSNLGILYRLKSLFVMFHS